MKAYFLLLAAMVCFGQLGFGQTEDYIQYVNPFVGTKNMGHT